MTEVVERMKGKKVVKPIVYGNTSSAWGYKRESDGHTHSWTVFLKPFYAEDPTKYIRKVQFKLHDSYANSTRVIEKPPYEVTESGWGEFEIQIRIYFTDPNEKIVTAYHYLRLFQPLVKFPDGSQKVIFEFYDELVFQEPTIPLYKALTSSSAKPDIKSFHNDLLQNCHRTKELAEAAKIEIQKEIEDMRSALIEAHRLIVKCQDELEQTESGEQTPQ